jgi:E3 ubiquitin-protein ligase TRIP12
LPPAPSATPLPQAFCARLLNIEYIDLAEQSLQALDKLSNEHPASLLQQGGLTAVLSYLDFFPTGVQRVAVATAAKMCGALAPQHAGAARDAVPLLTNLLQYQDGRIVDSACAALCCVAEAFSGDAALQGLLLSSGATGQAAQLVALSGATGGMAAQLSLGTYYGLIRLLATCAAGSPAVAESLLQGPLVDTLRQLLAGSAMLSSAAGQACVLRTADQLSEVVGLAAALLPPVPDAAAVMLQGLPSRPPGGGAGGAGSAGAAAAAAAAAGGDGARASFLRDHPEVLAKYTEGLLPLLLQVGTAPGVAGDTQGRGLDTSQGWLTVARTLEQSPEHSHTWSLVQGMCRLPDRKLLPHPPMLRVHQT